MIFHRFAVLICVISLASCVERGAVSVSDASGTGARVQQIFMATTRQKIPDRPDYSSFRTSKVSMARYDISVPTGHSPGKIEWPKDAPNADTDFVTNRVTQFQSRNQFRNAIRALPRTQGESVVFVHGYNNTFAEGLYRFAQIAHDMNLSGNKIHYSWPSGGDARGYVHDRDSILFARDGFEQMLIDVADSSPNGFFLVAHSIGAALALETLRQLSIAGNQKVAKSIKGVILLSPDIDVNIFALQMRRIKPLPKPFIIFASKRDLALRFSSFITGSQNRLGMVDNVELLKDLDVDLVDISAFSDGDRMRHSLAITSPALLAILSNPEQMQDLLDPNKSARRGTNVVSRIIQTANDATQIILNPN